jgi:hypothetical protein
MPRSSRSTLTALALVAALVVGGAACSSDDDDAATTTTTTEASRPGFSVETPAGQVSLSLDGELPPGWPDDFPLPEGAEPAGSGSLAGDDSGVRVGVFSTAEAPDEAFAFYTGESSLEPAEPRQVGIGDRFVGSVRIGGDYEGSVTVAGSSDTTYVVVVLEGASTGSTGTNGGDAGTTETTSPV